MSDTELIQLNENSNFTLYTNQFITDVYPRHAVLILRSANYNGWKDSTRLK